MPHIIVKLWPGKTQEQKMELASRFKKDLIDVMEVPESAVTVAFDEVDKENWYENVHIPLIDGNETGLVIKPEAYTGYKYKKE